jgi:hypothetical protein
MPVATTTTLGDATETARTGTFASGADEVTVHLGAVHRVTVTVAPMEDVGLEVVCGPLRAGASSRGSVTVSIRGGTALCVATLTLDVDAPRPASWRLVSS